MYLNVNSAFNCDGRSQGHPNGGAKSERANDAFGNQATWNRATKT